MIAGYCTLVAAVLVLGLVVASQHGEIRRLQFETTTTLPYTARAVRVPSVLGLRLSDAKLVVGSVGLTLSSPQSGTEADGDIVHDQDPSPGVEVKSRSVVQVKIRPLRLHEPFYESVAG